MVARVTPPTTARATGLSRRAALRLSVLAPVALAMTACSASEGRARLDAATDRLEAPKSTPPAPPNPDQPLVDEAIVAIDRLSATLGTIRAQHPPVADLIALHQAHLKRLGPASGPHSDGSLMLGGAPDVMTAVVAREKDLAATLAKLAAAAHDGDLARLLASMSAAIDQRVAVMA